MFALLAKYIEVVCTSAQNMHFEWSTPIDGTPELDNIGVAGVDESWIPDAGEAGNGVFEASCRFARLTCVSSGLLGWMSGGRKHEWD